MGILEIPVPVSKRDFTVKKFIKQGDNHYAEICPHQTVFRIKISSDDYYKSIKAHYSSKKIKCYPIEGAIENYTFEDAVYELVIE